MFAFSLSIDVMAPSMQSSGIRPVAGVTSGQIAAGQTVTWSAKHFGVRFRLTSVISAYAPPTRFVDEQVEAPFGVLGRVVDALVLERYMTRLIEDRNAWLKAQLEHAH